MNSLRHLVYAGQVDWELITAFKTSKAGEVEYQAQAAVTAYAHPTTYGRERNEISCLETFKCRSSRALEALAARSSIQMVFK